MRHACLVYAVPHAATETMKMRHFDIPAGASVYANVWRVMHNPQYWLEPEKFK